MKVPTLFEFLTFIQFTTKKEPIYKKSDSFLWSLGLFNIQKNGTEISAVLEVVTM